MNEQPLRSFDDGFGRNRGSLRSVERMDLGLSFRPSPVTLNVRNENASLTPDTYPIETNKCAVALSQLTTLKRSTF